MKTCAVCKDVKPYSDFYRNKTKGDGYQSYCKSCSLERRKQHYQDNLESHKKNIKEYKKRIKDKFIEFRKTLKCQNCGIDKHYLLEFHHHSDNKENSVGNMVNGNYSWKSIKKEIDKCHVLCANCHREIHFLERQKKKSIAQ